MASIFTRIIDGELPGRFVWKDDVCVAFLSIAPLKPGHTLVVPREEADHWLDLSSETVQHLSHVSKLLLKASSSVGRARCLAEAMLSGARVAGIGRRPHNSVQQKTLPSRGLS